MRKSWYVCALIAGWGLLGCEEQTAEQPLSTDIIFHTDLGDIGVHLYRDTPRHRQNFLDLSEQEFFDSLTFHRVIHNFVVQSGDPRSRYGTWEDSVMGPGYRLDSEWNGHHFHLRGALSMARKSDEENPERQSSGSQFFFVTGTTASPGLLDSMEQTATAIRRGEILSQYYQERKDSTFSGSFDQYLNQHPVSPFRYPANVRKSYQKTGGIPHLDFTYTVFGEVTTGLDVVMSISRQPAQESRLLNDVKIDSVTIVPVQHETSQTKT